MGIFLSFTICGCETNQTRPSRPKAESAKELQKLMITYNAFMAGQIECDENFNICENELSDEILTIANELGIDEDELTEFATEQFGVA